MVCFIYVIRAMLYSWFVPWIYVLGGGCFIMCAVWFCIYFDAIPYTHSTRWYHFSMSCVQTHSHTHTYTHANTHAYTHIYIYMCIYIDSITYVIQIYLNMIWFARQNHSYGARNTHHNIITMWFKRISLQHDSPTCVVWIYPQHSITMKWITLSFCVGVIFPSEICLCQDIWTRHSRFQRARYFEQSELLKQLGSPSLSLFLCPSLSLSMIRHLVCLGHSVLNHWRPYKCCVCCSVLQCVAVCCSVLCCSILRCIALHCSVLQCVADVTWSITWWLNKYIIKNHSNSANLPKFKRRADRINFFLHLKKKL